MTAQPLTPDEALAQPRRDWSANTDPAARREIEQQARAVKVVAEHGLATTEEIA